jgi:hypothetical protein
MDNDVSQRIAHARLLSSKNFLVVNRELIELYGTHGAVYLSNLIDKLTYYFDTGKTKDGSFFVSMEKQETQTGMSQRLLRRYKKYFQLNGILRIEKKGLPCREWFYLDIDMIIDLLTRKEKNTPSKSVRTSPYGSVRTSPYGSVRTSPYGSVRTINKTIVNETNTKKIKQKKKKSVLRTSPSSSTNGVPLKKNSSKERKAAREKRIHQQIAKKLFTAVCQIRKTTNAKRPASWTDTIRKIINIDGISIDKVTAAVDYLFDHPDCRDQPYCPIIDSANSLRVKFDKWERFIANQQSKGKGAVAHYASGSKKSIDTGAVSHYQRRNM